MLEIKLIYIYIYDKIKISVYINLIQTGPVRLFTPYKRRKRPKDSPDGEAPSRKHKIENSRDGSNNDESGDEVVVPDKEVWPQFVSTDGLVVQQPQEQDTVQNAHQTENCQSDEVFKKLDEMSNKMIKLAYEFRRILEEAKELNRQQRREQALVAQLGGRADVIETVGLQPASDSHNKKVNSKTTEKIFLFVFYFHYYIFCIINIFSYINVIRRV